MDLYNINKNKLSNLSLGGGCSGKLSQKELLKILSSDKTELNSDKRSRDNYPLMEDCSVSRGRQGYLTVESLDFGGLLLNDPFLFGKLSALNAVSDIYAVGGSPISAMTIMGWNTEIDVQVAHKIICGANEVSSDLGFTLSGGHTVASPNIFFGLSVRGEVKEENIKSIECKVAKSKIYITKPIGIGVFSSALELGLLSKEGYKSLVDVVLQNNKFGANLGGLSYVAAMTDISGFGLAGHLSNILRASDLSANVLLDRIPKIDGYDELLANDVFSPSVYRNADPDVIRGIDINEQILSLLYDPQTNGGLIVLVDENYSAEFEEFCNKRRQKFWQIGDAFKSSNNKIYIK